MGKEVSEKVDRSVQEHGTVAGLKFTVGGCVLDDSAVESVKVALDEVVEAKRVSEAMARRMQGILVYSASAFEWDTGDMTWWARTIAPITASYSGVGFKWTEECAVAVKILRSRVDAAERVP